jgi:hypothetical protein
MSKKRKFINDEEDKEIQTKKNIITINSKESFHDRREFLNNDLFSDFTVILPKGEKIKCHKIILSKSKLLVKNFDKEAYSFDQKEDDSIARSILLYLYTGEINITTKVFLLKFVKLSNSLEIDLSNIEIPMDSLFNSLVL